MTNQTQIKLINGREEDARIDRQVWEEAKAAKIRKILDLDRPLTDDDEKLIADMLA